MDDITYLMDISLSKLRENREEQLKSREAWHAAVHGGHKELDMTDRLNNSNKSDHKKMHFTDVL